MKTKFFYSMILAMGLLFAGSAMDNINGMNPKKTMMKQDSVKYTCPMHPEVVMNKPGKCPKCGMTLVEKKKMKQGMMDNKMDSTKKDTSKMKDMPM